LSTILSQGNYSVTGMARSTYTVLFIKDASSGDEYAVKMFPHNDIKAV